MHVVILARATRMQVIACMRKALATRGYIDADKPAARNASSISFDVAGAGDRIVCSFTVSGLHEQALAALAELGVEAQAARVEIIGQHVTWATLLKLSADGELDEEAHEEVAEEILSDWADGGYIDSSAEGSLCYALLELSEHEGVEQERLTFWRDPTRVIEEPPPPPPPPWRTFVHPDGRRWRVRVRLAGYDIEIIDADGDVIARARDSKTPEADVRVLVFEQQSEGFVEEEPPS